MGYMTVFTCDLCGKEDRGDSGRMPAATYRVEYENHLREPVYLCSANCLISWANMQVRDNETTTTSPAE